MKYRILVFGCLVLLLFSCGEIFEENISGNAVALTAPANNFQSRTYKQSFFWANVAGARSYRLQIAQPSFDSVQTLVVDTLLSDTKYVFSMSPGRYQWRVRGENGGYQGIYSVRNIEIFPSSLSKQQVILNGPVNCFLTNSNEVSFGWAALFGADNYVLQLDTNNFADTTKLVLNRQVKGVTLNYILSKDQKYQWRVIGINDSARSEFSAIQAFTVDTQAPNKVSLTSPATNAMVILPVSLAWQALNDAKQYELAVYQSDSVTLVANFPKILTTSSFSFTGGNPGATVIWRVRAKDAAGNTGVFSDFRSFVIR